MFWSFWGKTAAMFHAKFLGQNRNNVLKFLGRNRNNVLKFLGQTAAMFWSFWGKPQQCFEVFGAKPQQFFTEQLSYSFAISATQDAVRHLLSASVERIFLSRKKSRKKMCSFLYIFISSETYASKIQPIRKKDFFLSNFFFSISFSDR